MIPKMDYFKAPVLALPASAETVFRNEFAIAALTPNERLPATTLSAWRIVRSLAIATKSLQPDQPLAEIDLHAPTDYPELPPHHELTKALNTGRRLNQPHGLPILPPKDKMALFVAWKRAAYAIIELRGLFSGAPGHAPDVSPSPHLGRIGLMGLNLANEDAHLLDPVDFPDPELVKSMENHLIVEGQRAIIQQSTTDAPPVLVGKYGLSLQEARQVIELAKIQAGTLENDPDIDRGLMVLRLEDLIQRCRANFDLRGEAAALKQLAQVQGLTQDNEDLNMREMTRVVENIAQRRRLQEPSSEIDSGSSSPAA